VGRGPGTTAAASNESRNGSGSADTWAAVAPKGSRWRQRVRETKICEVIKAEKRVTNL
jgi:hypothetical protein